jgi:phosphoribosylglycinamide formyltransferase-1
MSRSKVIIFISGNGSNLQNIINNIDNDFLKMDITAVVSNNPNAKGLVRAKEAGIETMIIDTSNK